MLRGIFLLVEACMDTNHVITCVMISPMRMLRGGSIPFHLHRSGSRLRPFYCILDPEILGESIR